MSSRSQIGYIDIRVFAHATEDVDKVLEAVSHILPKGLIDNVAFKRTSLTGHHGNPIVLFEARLPGEDAAQAVLENLAAGLSSLDKELLRGEMEQRLEKGNLYLRLDKQSAYLNEFRLSSTDPVHFKIHFKKQKLENIMKICRDAGLLP
ncbi:MAG: RNA-binding domain-containing protein [Candidatus Bathycorpusculaceae bacterium]